MEAIRKSSNMEQAKCGKKIIAFPVATFLKRQTGNTVTTKNVLDVNQRWKLMARVKSAIQK